MKKFFLILALGVVGIASANTIDKIDSKEPVKKCSKKNEVKNEKPERLCGVHVNFYDSAGNVVLSQWYTSDQPSELACASYQAGVMIGLRSVGLSVDREW